MALKLGELVAYLRTDKSAFRRGLKDAEGQFRASGDRMERDSKTAGITSALAFVGQFGTKFGSMLPGSIGKVFGGLPPQVQAAAAAAAAAIGAVMAAALGAAITAGVLLAVGGGVLAAGIVAAADSPAVKSAWSRFADRAKAAFADFGKPFEGPLIRAADTFGDALDRMAPTLKEMGKSMAPVIDKLAPAFASLAEKSLPGIQKAMEASKPLFDKLAEHLPKIGESISKFFEKIAAGGPGATMFLDDFLTALEWLIEELGHIILVLSKIYEAAHKTWDGTKRVFAAGVKVVLAVLGTIIEGAAAAFGWIPGLGPKLKTANTEFNKFRTKANAELDKIGQPKLKVNKQEAERDIAAFNRNANHATRHRTMTISVAGGIIAGAAIAGRRAGGGSVMAGRSYWVGENGPEIVTPTTNGHVTPNHELGGPQVIENHIHIGDEVVRVVRTEIGGANRQLKRRALAGAGAR